MKEEKDEAMTAIVKSNLSNENENVPERLNVSFFCL
jgi:hypothetical protein